MKFIRPTVPTVERGTYGLRLSHAERDAREGFVTKNDTGLHAGDDNTSCVLGFMMLPHNTRLDD